ncbi:MAG TPA: hypothetical protein VFZ72_00050 [Jiangellaceae bacterium]
MIRPRHVAAVAAAAALPVVAFPLTVAPAHGTGVQCPDGFELASVTALVSAGYVVAGSIDDPSSGVESYGRPGNGNGWLCTRAMGNKTTHFGGQYYLFTDDGLRAG